ncbi:hypothetical protein GCM10022243_57090 [Saccharothrix violaceirubra]|uniref:FHA domain-containing protein n=1 Tax=Saccharothrix violaceirubra TaxID=413306 RepID=A0A7W7T3G7_9PSEU|nr:FHA domain-containing protein [Saccharothrix violaceirubra]MBB4965858.1 hypothetical protein [Saccharothrix violaceirubra]
MAACPSGHATAAEDYCDVCGASLAEPDPGESPVPALADCAACGTPREGRFCEECGHDSLAPVPVVRWHARAAPDRAYFRRVLAVGGPDADTLVFPVDDRPCRFDLTGPRVTVGRGGSRSRVPDRELDDPGVSHLHVEFVADGPGWAVVDLGSTNGTTVDDDPRPLLPHTPRPLADGSRVHLGAWTTITVHSH